MYVRRKSLQDSSGDDRDRTGNLLVANQALSQLSYVPDGCGRHPAARDALASAADPVATIDDIGDRALARRTSRASGDAAGLVRRPWSGSGSARMPALIHRLGREYRARARVGKGNACQLGMPPWGDVLCSTQCWITCGRLADPSPRGGPCRRRAAARRSPRNRAAAGSSLAGSACGCTRRPSCRASPARRRRTCGTPPGAAPGVRGSSGGIRLIDLRILHELGGPLLGQVVRQGPGLRVIGGRQPRLGDQRLASPPAETVAPAAWARPRRHRPARSRADRPARGASPCAGR